MSPLWDLSSADLAFFEAIAGRFDRLESVLYDRFVYRTTANTLLDKRALIQYLRGDRVRVSSPVILQLDHVTSDRTSVHRGQVRMLVEDGTSQHAVTSGFLHVWVSNQTEWQLVYREAILASTA